MEYINDIDELLENFYYDSTDFYHVERSKNKKLVQKIGRRTTVANNTNHRLAERFRTAENEIWKDKELYEIDLSHVHSFFSN